MQGLSEMAQVQVVHMREIRKALGYEREPVKAQEWRPVLLFTLVCSTIGVILSHTMTLGV